MSAWIVGKENIDSIVSYVFGEGNGEIRRKIAGTATPENFGKALWAMNHKAVNYRYSERNKVPKYIWTRTECSYTQLLKSLHCFRYQCSEGKVPEMGLFKRVGVLIGMVADDIATGLPEYIAADWR